MLVGWRALHSLKSRGESGEFQQRLDLGLDFRDLGGSCLTFAFCLSSLPVQAFYLVGQGGAGGSVAFERDLEGIALNLVRDGDAHQRSGAVVVSLGTQDNRRSTPGLLVTALRREIHPDDVPFVRHIGCNCSHP